MKSAMTSRERVRKAINFEEPDRVPIDIGGSIISGIHIDEYCEIVRHLGIDSLPPKLSEQYMMVTRNDEMMMRWLHCDVIHLENPSMNWGYKNKDWKIWRTYKGNDVLVPGQFNAVEKDNYLYLYDSDNNKAAYMDKGGSYFDKIIRKSNAESIEFADIAKWKQSLPLYTDEELRELETKAKFYYEHTDYSILGGSCRGQIGTFGLYAGHTLEEWLIILLTEKEYAFEVMSASVDRAIENYKLYLDAVGKYIDVTLVSTMDYGTQKCEMFNPEIFKELYAPNYKRINDFIHKYGNVKTLFHCCGSIANIMEYMIDSGVDILNPVQTSAENMDPQYLKDKFGGRIVFWGGGADTQHVMPNAMPEEVKEHVKDRIKIFAPGGGFVFTQIHNLQQGIPFENIAAMIESVLEFGNYPII